MSRVCPDDNDMHSGDWGSIPAWVTVNLLMRYLPADGSVPVNKRHLTGVGLMLGHRRRRWPSIKLPAGQRVMFARVEVARFHDNSGGGSVCEAWSVKSMSASTPLKQTPFCRPWCYNINKYVSLNRLPRWVVLCQITPENQTRELQLKRYR